MDLTIVWFGLIALLWTGYLVLEGFDFGVGMLLHQLPRDRRERRVMINTVGPVFDGNEVWLITAAGAMFAAFPEWYATTFSAYYLPLLLVLLALIVRNVGFEFRHKWPDLVWQQRWERAITVGSVVPAVVWGVLLTGLVGGIPIDADAVYVGGLAELFTPYALLGGLVTSTLFLTHGALFTALKTVGPLRHRARALALRLGALSGTSLAALVLWTSLVHSDTLWTLVLGAVAVAALALGLLAARLGREGWAFVGTSLAVAALVGTLYATLFPNLVVSSLDPAWNLTIANASSTPYTLSIMTVASLVTLPVVIGYQAWTYWVFRQRLGTQHMPDDELVAAGRGA